MQVDFGYDQLVLKHDLIPGGLLNSICHHCDFSLEFDLEVFRSGTSVSELFTAEMVRGFQNTQARSYYLVNSKIEEMYEQIWQEQEERHREDDSFEDEREEGHNEREQKFIVLRCKLSALEAESQFRLDNPHGLRPWEIPNRTEFTELLVEISQECYQKERWEESLQYARRAIALWGKQPSVQLV